MNDPRIVWRYTIEYSTPTDDRTETRSGRARAYTEDAVEDWLVADLTNKYGDDFTVIDCKVWPAANKTENDPTTPTIISGAPAGIRSPEPPPPNKVEKSKEEPLPNVYSKFPITPGVGIGGMASKRDSFYEAIKEATSV